MDAHGQPFVHRQAVAMVPPEVLLERDEQGVCREPKIKHKKEANVLQKDTRLWNSNYNIVHFLWLFQGLRNTLSLAFDIANIAGV